MGIRTDYGGQDLYVNAIYDGVPFPGLTETNYSFDNPYGSVASRRFVIRGISFNEAPGAQVFASFSFPGYSLFLVNGIYICNASHTLSTAHVSVTIGVVTVAADQALTVTSASPNTNNNVMSLALTNATTTAFDDSNLTIVVTMGTPEGVAATGDIVFIVTPLS
jgi:hypothetical protein